MDNTSEHESLFKWKNNSYRLWVVNLESFRGLVKSYGHRFDAFMLNDGEHFEELRQSTMLEF